MEDQAKDVLAQMVQRALDGVDAAVDFSQAQIPDVVEQLLMWKAIESGVYFSISLTLLVFLAIMAKWVLGKKPGDRLDPGQRGEYSWSQYRKTFFFDGDGDRDIGFYMSLMLLGLLFLCSMCSVLSNTDWLKIWVAPKLYLLEYAASLVN